MKCSKTAEIFRTNEALNLMTANPQIEQWLTVPCAADYEVSNHGRIRRGERMLAATIDEAAREIERLTCICENAHDRLLRGDDDSELLAILEQAWNAREAVASP